MVQASGTGMYTESLSVLSRCSNRGFDSLMHLKQEWTDWEILSHNIELLFSCIMSTFCVRWKSEILMIHDSCVIKISESFSSKWDIYYESSHSFNLWCTWTLATDSFFTRPLKNNFEGQISIQKFTATVIFVCLLLLCFEQNICCNVDKPTINL